LFRLAAARDVAASPVAKAAARTARRLFPERRSLRSRFGKVKRVGRFRTTLRRAALRSCATKIPGNFFVPAQSQIFFRLTLRKARSVVPVLHDY
jgi:hypothetical protein